MKTQFQNIYELYQSCRQEWERNRPRWIDISRFVGITVDTNYVYNSGNNAKKGQDLDVFVDDPTAALCVNQSGDYLMGVMWGTGDRVFDIVPSRYVTGLVDEQEVKDWYSFATEQALYHMNHEDAGLATAMKPYTYDQMSFGTSAIGTFLNKSFMTGVSENALVFRNYGVDNLMVDEGTGGQCDIVFVVHNWRINRIVGEFCKDNGEVSDEKVNALPTALKDAYRSGNYNQNFRIVFGFYPREDYDPKLRGKRGAKYKGVWFLDSVNENKPFFEEDFIDRPIAVARAIKVRGEVYGRASGTLLNSTIKGVNFMVGTAIEIIEKMSNPSLGLLSNSIFGDSVLDTSPNGLTIFQNAAVQAAGGSPTFPLYDVGDPSAILQFLVPYLNEKITTGFKVDALLDFSSAKEMTATESLQRYAIRGKSLSGMLLQQKNEELVPMSKRSISLLMGIGELGVVSSDPSVRALRNIGQDRRVIPDAVMEVMRSGKPWYQLKWNNELEKLVRTEAVQNLIQIIQAITAIAALYPDIVQAVDWYKLLKDINDNLDINNKILITANEFKAKIEQAAKERAQMMSMQAGEMQSKSQSNMAKANKDNEEAKNVRSQ